MACAENPRLAMVGRGDDICWSNPGRLIVEKEDEREGERNREKRFVGAAAPARWNPNNIMVGDGSVSLKRRDDSECIVDT